MRMAFMLAVAVTMMACDDTDGDPSSYVGFADLESGSRDARCTYLARCGWYPDKATCLTANLPTLADVASFELDPSVVAAVNAGRVRYNGARAKDCFDAISASSCDRTDGDGRSLFRVCSHYLTGTVAGGQPCFVDEECISQRCSANQTETQCLAGACVGDTAPAVEPAGLGMPCSDAGCANGYCDLESDTCLALRREGEACVASVECSYGLACVGVTAYTCKKLPALGEACPDDACRDDNTYCVSGTCRARGLAGAHCDSWVDCAEAYPCDLATNTCRRAPALGESCAADVSIRCFDAGVVCDSETYKCIAPKADGMSCINGFDCASGSCGVTSGRCEAAIV